MQTSNETFQKLDLGALGQTPVSYTERQRNGTNTIPLSGPVETLVNLGSHPERTSVSAPYHLHTQKYL